MAAPQPHELPYLRYVIHKTGANERTALLALHEAQDDPQAAVRAIRPEMALRRFVDYYYPYDHQRVPDPLQDLPFSTTPIVPSALGCDEDRNDRGERAIAPFGDPNGLGDIVGGLFHVGSYPECWDEGEVWLYPTLQGAIMEGRDRLARKLQGRLKPIQARYFHDALAALAESAGSFASGNLQHGRGFADDAVQLIETGNRLRKSGRQAILLGPGAGS